MNPETFNVDPEKLVEVFKMLEQLAPTETFKTTLSIMLDSIKNGITTEQMALVMGLSGVSTLLETQQAIVKQLEAQTAASKETALQIELLTGAMNGVRDAINHYTHERLHTVR